MPAPRVQSITYATTLVSLPVRTPGYTAGDTLTFDTSETTYAALDITLTALNGGTTPTANFTLQRQGADGVWYLVWTSTPQSSAVTYSIDLSPSIALGTTGNPNAPSASVHNVFTASARFVYAFTGSPTSVNFSASLFGR